MQKPIDDETLWGDVALAAPEPGPCSLKDPDGACPPGCDLCRHWPEPFEPML